MTDESSAGASQGEIVMFDYCLVGIGLIAMMRAYEIAPEEPAAMLVFFGAVPLVLGAARIIGRKRGVQS